MTKPLRTAPHDLTPTPLVSTVARGGRITSVAPGRPVGRMNLRLLSHLVASGTAWAAAGSVPFVALLGLAPTREVELALGSPWAAGAAIVLTYVAIVRTLRLRADVRASFGQARVTHLLSSLSVTGGLATGAAAWFVAGLWFDHAPLTLDRLAPSTTVPRELGALVGTLFAAWTALTIVLLVIAVRDARSQQQRVDALQRHGETFSGVLETVHFRKSWLRDQPQFTIEVSYTAPDGPRRIGAHLLTDASQVPVVGSPMIVLTDGRGTTHVDLDHGAGITYLDDHTRYEASRD